MNIPKYLMPFLLSNDPLLVAKQILSVLLELLSKADEVLIKLIKLRRLILLKNRPKN